MSKLAPGGVARIYRDGEVLEGLLLVPVEGRFEVRHLAPGQYVARDECGGEVAFEVLATEEISVIQGQGSPDGPTGAPGAGHVQPLDTREVGPQQVPNEFKPEAVPTPAKGRALSPARAASDRDRTPGAAGSALIDSPEQPAAPQPVKKPAAKKRAAPKKKAASKTTSSKRSSSPVKK